MRKLEFIGTLMVIAGVVGCVAQAGNGAGWLTAIGFIVFVVGRFMK